MSEAIYGRSLEILLKALFLAHLAASYYLPHAPEHERGNLYDLTARLDTFGLYIKAALEDRA